MEEDAPSGPLYQKTVRGAEMIPMRRAVLILTALAGCVASGPKGRALSVDLLEPRGRNQRREILGEHGYIVRVQNVSDVPVAVRSIRLRADGRLRPLRERSDRPRSTSAGRVSVRDRLTPGDGRRAHRTAGHRLLRRAAGHTAVVVSTPNSRATSTIAATARSRCWRVCAALIWQRSRAWPWGTTGNPNPET